MFDEDADDFMSGRVGQSLQLIPGHNVTVSKKIENWVAQHADKRTGLGSDLADPGKKLDVDVAVALAILERLSSQGGSQATQNGRLPGTVQPIQDCQTGAPQECETIPAGGADHDAPGMR